MARIKIKDLTEAQKNEQISEEEVQKVRGGFGGNVNIPRQGLAETQKGWTPAPSYRQEIFRR